MLLSKPKKELGSQKVTVTVFKVSKNIRVIMLYFTGKAQSQAKVCHIKIWMQKNLDTERFRGIYWKWSNIHNKWLIWPQLISSQILYIKWYLSRGGLGMKCETSSTCCTTSDKAENPIILENYRIFFSESFLFFY